RTFPPHIAPARVPGLLPVGAGVATFPFPQLMRLWQPALPSHCLSVPRLRRGAATSARRPAEGEVW
ncbi:MAG: hypothetical protein ACRDZX_04270, partial [Acidimicrobiales bacterium]